MKTRIFKHHGGPAKVDIGGLLDDMTLEEVSLPSESGWQVAVERANAIFGLPASALLNAANVSNLGESIGEKVNEWIGPLCSLIGRLESIQAARFSGGVCVRLETAQEALSLLKTLEGMDGNSMIGKLAGFGLQKKPTALAVSLANSGRLDQALEGAEWDIFDGIRTLNDDRKEAADRVWKDLEEAFNSDEYAVALQPKLTELRQKGVKLLATAAPQPATPSVVMPVEPPSVPSVPPPPVKTAMKLKELYRDSQIAGDDLPGWISEEETLSLLRVCCVGGDSNDWNSLVVVSPLYDALIQLDKGASIDLQGKT